MANGLTSEQLQPVRGSRDFSGPEKKRRDSVVQFLSRLFQTYSFEPLETPAMERLEVLSSKFAGGAGILKEIFRATDQGGRELGLRYDLTVPLCRFVAQNTRMPFPFKRYAIAPVWRDGPLKAGRYREFYQCDADIVGAKGMLADAEIIKLACDAFDALFPTNYGIKVSNRKILDGILEYSGVSKDKLLAATLAVDKLDKIGKNGVARDLLEEGIGDKAARKILQLISLEGNNAELISELDNLLDGIPVGREGIAELKSLFLFADAFGATDKVQFTPSLARGLNYYTGTIFEAFTLEGKITSSIAGGGRYDDLIGNFAGAKEIIPAVGISFGLDVICEALKEEESGSNLPIQLNVYVCIASKEQDVELENYAIRIAGNFRSASIPSFLDLSQRSIGKNLEYASKKGYKYAAIVGKEELADGAVKLRELSSGEEKTLSMKDAVNALVK